MSTPTPPAAAAAAAAAAADVDAESDDAGAAPNMLLDFTQGAVSITPEAAGVGSVQGVAVAY